MTINIDKILLEIESIPNIKKHTQVMLQTIENCEDPLYGIGSILRDFEGTNEEQVKAVKEIEKTFIFPLWPKLVYTNSILKNLQMYRTRIMTMKPKTCYTYHIDASPRIHIPLVTNDDCFFIIEDEVLRIPADGNHYCIDTTKKHTFVNASFEDRIHIVGVYEKFDL